MYTKRITGAAIYLCMALITGCGSEEGPTTPPSGPVGDPPLRSFTVDLANVDDAARLAINGQAIELDNSMDPEPVLLDRYLLPGENTLEVRLYNGGCFASSLDLTIIEDGRISVPTRSFSRSVSDCGLQLTWIYTINQRTGITMVQ